MNEHMPTGDYLRLTQEELRSLFTSTARALVLYGEVAVNNDGDVFKKPLDKTPYLFSYTLPNKFAKEVFFSDGDVVPIEARVEYSDKHCIDDAVGFDSEVQSLYIMVRGVISGQDIYVDHTVRISQDDRQGPDFTAGVDVQYSDFEGNSISMAPVEGERLDETIMRYAELTRELMVDDVEHVRQVADYVLQHGRHRG